MHRIQSIIVALCLAYPLGVSAQSPQFGIGISFGAGSSLVLDSKVPMLRFPVEWPAYRLRIEPALSYSASTVEQGDLTPPSTTLSSRQFELQILQLKPLTGDFGTSRGIKLGRVWNRNEYATGQQNNRQSAKLLGVIGLEYRLNPRAFIAFEAGAGLNWTESNSTSAYASRAISTLSSSSMSLRLMF